MMRRGRRPISDALRGAVPLSISGHGFVLTFAGRTVYKTAVWTGITGLLRFITSFFGAIFTMVTMGLLFAALTVGGIFYMYSRDLPSHESLATYAPPTISRIYSAEGRIMDEFATERRLFVPISDIPDLVKDAFISAEDKHFYMTAATMA